MSSRSLLAQDDFSSLGLAIDQDSGCQPLDYLDGLTTVERSERGDSLISGSACEADEIYRPVNVFPDEVNTLFRN